MSPFQSREPFGGLDALTRAHLQEEVMKLHAELGNSVLMITHDVDEAVKSHYVEAA